MEPWKWNFKVFITHGGANEIDDWLQKMPPGASARIRAIIKYLETEKKWPKNYFKNIIGYANIYELRCIYKDVQYRPLGCFGPGGKEFTLLIPAIEQGDRLIPRTAPGIAVKRCKLIHKNSTNKRRHTDDFV